MRADRIPQRGLVWDALGNGALLGCALAGSALSFFTLYAGPELDTAGVLGVYYVQTGAARIAGLALLLALASLGVWSLPRRRLPVVGALCAGWAGAVWLRWEDFSAGALSALQSMADLFSQRVGWIAPLRLSQGLTLQAELEAVRLFTLLALSMLALLLGGAVVRVRRWWLVVLLTLPPLLPGLLSDVYPDWAAFLALAGCWCAMLLCDLCRDAAPAGRGKLTLLTLAAAGALLAGLIAVKPPEDYRRPAWTAQAREALEDFGTRRLTFLQDLDGPFRGQVTYVGGADKVDLTAAGPLRYSGQTVLKVTSGWEGQAYLRGASLANYEDGVWTALEDGAYDRYAQRAGSGALSPLLFPAQAPEGETYAFTVENTGASGSCVYAPYQLAEQDFQGAGVLLVEDSYLAHRRGMWSHTLRFTPLSAEAPVVSSNPQWGDWAASYGDLVQSYYSHNNVPAWLYAFLQEEWDQTDTMLETVRRFVREEPGLSALDPVGAAQGIAAFLGERYTYDPDVPAAPEGEDPVRYFLSESHRGYCMHFASSAVLLLRSLGVPARYVSGFTAELQAGRTVNVPDSAAHAWVEVWVDGYGWYPVEVTPDSENALPGEAEDPAASPTPEPSEQPDATPTPSAAPTPAPGGGEAPDGSEDKFTGIPRVLLRALPRLALALALAGLVWLGQAVPRRVRRARLHAPDAKQAVLDGYRYLTQLEKWGASMPETALDLARKARFSQHAVTEDERRAMADMVDGARAQIQKTLKPPKAWVFRCWWGTPKK